MIEKIYGLFLLKMKGEGNSFSHERALPEEMEVLPPRLLFLAFQ